MQIDKSGIERLVKAAISEEPQKLACGQETRLGYTSKLMAPNIVRAYCRAVNAGRITADTTTEGARRELTGFSSSIVLLWIGREALILLLKWLAEQIFRKAIGQVGTLDVMCDGDRNP